MLNALIRRLATSVRVAHAKGCIPHQPPTANR
jgi:hypothetical protein